MRNNRMTIVLGSILLGLLVSPVSAADNKDQQNAALAFNKLKSLAGQWEATTGKGKVITSYEVVANGTALLERIKMAGESEMLTVYHLDGNHLVLTHYCEAGNQPTMQAETFDPGSNELRFRFLNATNLSNPNAGHMHDAVFKWGEGDQFTADWAWQENGKTAFHAVIEFHRIR